ncbi:hypothetical protein ACLB9X_02405 [Streptomyces sp. 5K101]|uniref:hypothetical protein n=1 Tax=Streptomyces sp. 5K101 TaxID=3390037 RepID=UPI0039763E38
MQAAPSEGTPWAQGSGRPKDIPETAVVLNQRIIARHPFVRRAVEGGEQVVRDRLAEEKSAKETLAALDDMDTDDPKFMPRLMQPCTEVQEHARAEERYEFAHIRRSTDVTNLAAVAKAVKAAEAMAPTRPHPGVESATANVALGPVAALMDRTKDAVRKAMGKS